LSGLNSNSSTKGNSVEKSGGETPEIDELASRPTLLTELSPILKFFPSFKRVLLPSFIRHNAYHFSHRIYQALRYESETGTKFLMLPIAFGLGALAYFSLPREPLFIAIIVALMVSVLISIKRYGAMSGNVALVASFVFAGMAAGKIRSDVLDTIMISSPAQVMLSGIVLNRELRANGRQRYTIKVKGFEKYRGPVPQKIRVTAHKKHARIEIGRQISGLARLRPPSGPAYPGGYDFAFQSWYKKNGANGFFLGGPKGVEYSGELSVFTRLSLATAKIRSAIGGRIRDALPGESGSLASALIVGDRSGISDDTVEALRQSGLAHILAISGLHMALVTATIILLVRGSLAMIPGISLYYPIRKWAAMAALLVASAYLLISGASIATQRAWIMIAIMLLAVMSDRRALTMRNVGLAALVVLAWRPESIVSPSFQMSFAAVAALVAVYESWSRFRRGRPYQPSPNRFWAVATNIAKSISGLAVTSIVAGLATGLFAAYHFHRVAPFGLLANLAAMPVVSLGVMPMALVGMVLMPFGLEAYPLELMGFAIDQVVKVSIAVSDLGQFGNTGFMPLSSLTFGTIALVIATQLKSVLRLLAIPFVMLSALTFSNAATPDILISQSGSSIAVVGKNGQFHLLNPRKEKFITNIWRKAFAPNAQNDQKNSQVFKCDELGCIANISTGVVLSFIKRSLAFREDCARADIIVTRLSVPKWCTAPQLIVDKSMLQSRGAVAITISKHDTANAKPVIEVRTALQKYARPWSRHRKN